MWENYIILLMIIIFCFKILQKQYRCVLKRKQDIKQDKIDDEKIWETFKEKK